MLFFTGRLLYLRNTLVYGDTNASRLGMDHHAVHRDMAWVHVDVYLDPGEDLGLLTRGGSGVEITQSFEGLFAAASKTVFSTNGSFAAFFKICRIGTLLHRSTPYI